MKEKSIEMAVCKYAKEYGGFLVFKFSSPGSRGVPDRMWVLDGGKVVFVEFKSRGRKPTVLQAHVAGKLRAKGVSVYLVDDVAIGKKLVDDLKNGTYIAEE